MKTELEHRLRRCSAADREWVLRYIAELQASTFARRRGSLVADQAVVIRDQSRHIANLEDELRPRIVAEPAQQGVLT